MDLVDYSEVYNKIKADFEALNAKVLSKKAKRELHFNRMIKRMPWVQGTDDPRTP
jgi:sulfate adenylyltransferase subunit 1 (EFTu-like GTPase family)